MNMKFEFMKIAERIVRTKYLNRWIVMMLDVLLSTGVTLFAYCFVRYLREENVDWFIFGHLAIIAVIISCGTLALMRSYRMVMRFTTLRETWRIGCAMFLKVIALYPLISVSYPFFSKERLIVGGVLDMMTSTVVLVAVRVVLVTLYGRLKKYIGGKLKRVLIYGMNDQSASLNMALSNNFLPSYKVVGYLVMGKRYKHLRLSGESVYFAIN